MVRTLTVLIVLLAAPWVAAASVDPVAWQARVHQVVVTRVDGVQELGSAVALAGERLVTNCHVLRNAARIDVRLDGIARQASTSARDAYRDLCFLDLPGHEVGPVPTVEVGETRVGMDVVAVGYPGGEFAVRPGRIVGLHHCECDGGRVIQTSADFDRGASGGGLFDRQGRLVGILTFKARSGGNFHFALPVGWLRHVATAGSAVASGASFWESAGSDSAYFLAACDLGAQQKWESLERLSEEWTGKEPSNPEAWMAWGRAKRGMGQTEGAVAAFQRVLMLDSTHAEAQWALEQLEFELGRSLSVSDRL
jgi:serine protease Do